MYYVKKCTLLAKKNALLVIILLKKSILIYIYIAEVLFGGGIILGRWYMGRVYMGEVVIWHYSLLDRFFFANGAKGVYGVVAYLGPTIGGMRW